jgi:hypothetical protein
MGIRAESRSRSSRLSELPVGLASGDILCVTVTSLLWCCALSHRYFCTTKTQLREIIGFLIPLAKMLVLMKGTEPQDGFTKYSN